MNALLRLVLHRRDDTGRWMPVGWGSRLAVVAGLLMLSWFPWQRIMEVRRGVARRGRAGITIGDRSAGVGGAGGAGRQARIAGRPSS
jgi:hypothetical protein